MAAKKTVKRAGTRAVAAGKKKVVRSAPSSRKVAAKPSPKVAAKPSPKVAAKPSPKVAAKPSPKVAAKAREASAAGAGVAEGDAAPSFELLAQEGASLSSADLAGKAYVLYFYPKDDTPGCTTEACGFRDALPDFKKLGVRVIGVSPDSSSSHERFVAKYSLPFTLLSDPDKALSAAYGVWAKKQNYGREYMGVVRSTFLIDSMGVVRKAWRSVKVKGHVEQVQAAAAALS
jgi:thioredoxin-dependent peroxiredoxin